MLHSGTSHATCTYVCTHVQYLPRRCWGISMNGLKGQELIYIVNFKGASVGVINVSFL